MCPELMNPANGIVDVRGRTIGSQAIYDCDNGFAASGPVVRTCGTSGQWGGVETMCINISTVMCPALPNPVNGAVNIVRNEFGGVAIYSCDPGFTSVGIIVRTCTVTGEWSGVPPTCQRKQLNRVYLYK